MPRMIKTRGSHWLIRVWHSFTDSSDKHENDSHTVRAGYPSGVGGVVSFSFARRHSNLKQWDLIIAAGDSR